MANACMIAKSFTLIFPTKIGWVKGLNRLAVNSTHFLCQVRLNVPINLHPFCWCLASLAIILFYLIMIVK